MRRMFVSLYALGLLGVALGCHHTAELTCDQGCDSGDAVGSGDAGGPIAPMPANINVIPSEQGEPLPHMPKPVDQMPKSVGKKIVIPPAGMEAPEIR